MFLIENKKGNFFDAEKIDSIRIDGDLIFFSLAGEDARYSVESSLTSQFLDQIQALNKSRTNIEGRYEEINNEG